MLSSQRKDTFREIDEEDHTQRSEKVTERKRWVSVLLFARVRDLLGRSEIAVELDETRPQTVATLLSELEKNYPKINEKPARLLDNCAIALNEVRLHGVS